MFLKTVGYVLRYFRVGSLFPRDLFSKTTTFYQNGGAHRHVVRLIGHPVDFWEISSWLKETEDLGTLLKTIKPSKSLAFHNEMSHKFS